MALLTTEPLLMDHLSAARGYGLALGFTMAALDELVLCMETRPRRSWYAAGICLGLSVSSNLAWLFPAAGIGLATIAVAAMEGDFRFDRFWSELFVPAWLSAFVLLVLPLSKARPEQFYFGAKRFSDFVRSMLDGAFSHGTVPLPWTTDLDYALDLLKIAVRPVLLGILVLCAAFVLQGLRRSAPPKRVSGVAERRAFFFATSLLAVLALLFAAHVLAGVAYPLSRTGLYFVPLVILATSSTVYVYRRLRPVSGFGGAVATICLVAFLLQTDTSYYAEWRFDAGTKRIVNLIRFRWPPQPRRTIRATWDLEPTLNFYRLLYGLDWDPIDRGGVDRPGDVFILTTEDQTPERVSRLRVVYRDTVSRTLVALPQEAKASGK